MKTGQPIREHPSACAEVLLRPGSDFRGAESVDDRQLHAQRVSLLVGLDGGHKRRLCRCATTALGPTSFATEVGIIELDPAGERKLSVSLHHHLHQLVSHAPRRVVGDAQMAVQLHRRDPFLVLGHEVDGLEPHGERQFGGTEDGARGDRGLAVAAIALLQFSAGQLAAPVMGAVWAWKTVRPAPLKERVEALVFGSIEREEFVQADSFLKLHWVACHVNFLLRQWYAACHHRR